MATPQKKRGPIAGFNFVQDECVWVKAGVVGKKFCDNAFDCPTCAFDKAMTKRMAKETHKAGWSGKMIDLPTDRQGCRHALTGRAPAAKLCARSYQCGDCPFDQMMDDTIQADYTLMGPPKCLSAAGYAVPEDYYVHGNHAWARVEYGARVRVGLDDFGNRLVGKADSVGLPSVGTRVKAGEQAYVIARDGNEAAVKAPLSGVVVAVNPDLQADPGCANTDPYGRGWAILLEPEDLRPELKGLHLAEDSVKFIESEAQSLLSIIGQTAQTREPLSDVYGTFKAKGWENLVLRFL